MTQTELGAVVGTVIVCPFAVMVVDPLEGLLELDEDGDEDEDGDDGVEPPDVGCGVLGSDVLGFDPVGCGVLGLDDGVPDGLGLDEDPPSPIDRIGVGEDVGFVLGSAAGAASLFTVGLLLVEVGVGLNTPSTVVPSQLSGFHQVTDELGLGVLLGAEDGTEVAVWLGGAVLPVGAVVGTGLVGGAVADGGALDGRLDGAGCCGVLPLEVGCGAPGVGAAPDLLAEELGVLGVEDGALVFGAA